MSYRINDPTGQIVGDFGRVPAPRFERGDLVVEVIQNELYQVVDYYSIENDSGEERVWIFVCQQMEIHDDESRITQVTTCGADYVDIPDDSLQPLPPQRLPEEPKSLPPAPPPAAVPQTLVLRSFLPPKEKPALTGPQEALQPPQSLRPQGLLLSKNGGGS